MKRIFLLLSMLSMLLGASAQTDVTDQYLTNAGFDEASDFVSSVVYTYASDANNNGGVSSCQQVTGWTADATGDAKAGGAFRYGSGYGLSGTAYVVPETDAEGHATGGALGLAGCWGNGVGYSQNVKLPAGLYRISYKVYNAGTNNIANYDNQIGFIEDSGTTHIGSGEFYAREWTEGMIYFYLPTETSGRIHVGNSCANVGSGSTPKLFLDYIKIETYTATESSLLEYMTSQVGTGEWGGSGTYTAEGITGRESFQWAASLPLGERMGQTLSGLPNGTYHLSMYVAASSTSGRDNTGNVITDGNTDYVSLHANNVSHGVPAYNRTEFSKYDRIELNNIQVTDGTLKIYLNQDKTGPNWLVMQIRELSCVRHIPPLRYTIGDVNEDGEVSIADVTALVNIILGKQASYRMELADTNEDQDVSIADVTALVNIILGKQPAKVVDNSYLYANINAMVYAEQSATENDGGADYTMNSATGRTTGEDVSNQIAMTDYLTTLRISTILPDVKSISIYAQGKEAIAGPITVLTAQGALPQYTYEAGTESTYANSLQSDVITVTGSQSGTYVAYLRPVGLANGVLVTVRTTDGKLYSQTFSDIQTGKENDLTFTETSASNLWMSTLPGNVYFSMISTPGAHNAATSSCGSAAKCQSETIEGLLNNGVRAFDIRPGYTYSTAITVDNLYIYHGMVNTNVLYKDAVKAMADFLQAHPSEAISVIMVKEDGTPLFSSWTDYTTEMCNAINEIHSTYTDYLKILDHSYYTLDDFRGKIFFGYRNAWDLHKTVRVTNWPDASSVTNYGVGVGGTCSASVEDAYNTSGNSKKTVVNALLNLASANTDQSKFHYTFTSVANSITSQANIQNPAAAQYISGTLTGPTGYVYADFMGSSSYGGQALLKAVIEQNYKYVFKGRSRME